MSQWWGRGRGRLLRVCTTVNEVNGPKEEKVRVHVHLDVRTYASIDA